MDLCLEHYKYIFQPDLFRGHVAFITGGGSGICFTIAEIFMRHGCDTVIAGRNKKRVEDASERLEKATGRQCLPLAMDVRKPKEVESAVDEALNKFRKITIVINGAAGNFLCPAASMSYNAFKTVMEIDALGTFNVSKAVYGKYFKNNGGVIINITATLHYDGRVLQAHAGSAKAAIEALTKHLAVEWGPQRVRVVCVAPGPVTDTEGYRKLGGKFADESFFKSIPLQRASSKEEIANAVLSLASDVGAMVTGSTLVVDGGEWLTRANSMEQMSSMFHSKM